MSLKDLVFKWRFIDKECVCFVDKKPVAKIVKSGWYDWWVIKQVPFALARMDRLCPYLDEAKEIVEDLIRTETYLKEREKSQKAQEKSKNPPKKIPIPLGAKRCSKSTSQETSVVSHLS